MQSLPETILIDHLGWTIILLFFFSIISGYFLKRFFNNEGNKYFYYLLVPCFFGFFVIFLLFFEENNYEHWKENSFTTYIQTLPIKKESLSDLALLDKENENKPGYYYVKAAYGGGKIYEGVAKVVTGTKTNEVMYREVKHMKENELNGEFLMEIHIGRKPLSVIDNIGELHYNVTPYYPGFEENNFSYWKIPPCFLIFVAFTFVFAIPFHIFDGRRRRENRRENEETLNETMGMPVEIVEEPVLAKFTRIIRK